MDEEATTRRTLWENCRLLMLRDFGEENLGKAATAAGFSPANMTRVKAMNTDLSLKVLGPLARGFKVPIWQLLAPQLGARLHVIEGAQIVPLFNPASVRGAEDLIDEMKSDAAGGTRRKRTGTND